MFSKGSMRTETKLTQAIGNRSSGCSLPSLGTWTGSQEYTNCSVTDGCNYVPPSSDTSSYGDSFNAIGGGVYAMLWSSTTLQVWHFPRGGIPLDITSKTPNPNGWGTPQALFGTSSCNVNKHFADMSIVLNIVSSIVPFEMGVMKVPRLTCCCFRISVVTMRVTHGVLALAAVMLPPARRGLGTIRPS